MIFLKYEITDSLSIHSCKPIFVSQIKHTKGFAAVLPSS